MKCSHHAAHVDDAAPAAAAGGESADSKAAEAPEKPAWVANISSQLQAFELLAGPDNAAKLQDLLERIASSLEVDSVLQTPLFEAFLASVACIFVSVRHAGTHGLCEWPVSCA